MNRQKVRVRCQSGIYHILIRGVNRQMIFEDVYDNRRFLDTLKTNSKNAGMEIYAWVLMGNHVHLLAKEGDETISETMQRIGVSYVMYFNKKYERVGPLFQGRFKSKPILDDISFQRVQRYIAMNPVKAGLVNKPEDYRWSWIGQAKEGADIIHSTSRNRNNVILAIPDELDSEDVETFDDFPGEELWHGAKKKLMSDIEAMKEMSKLVGCRSASDFQQLSLKERDAAVKVLLSANLTPTQINRIAGVNRATVYRIKKRIP